LVAADVKLEVAKAKQAVRFQRHVGSTTMS
jgi:hypothetical protein